jgi:hypothetical protein
LITFVLHLPFGWHVAAMVHLCRFWPGFWGELLSVGSAKSER